MTDPAAGERRGRRTRRPDAHGARRPAARARAVRASQAGGVDARLLVLVLMGLFLALAAWRVTRDWRAEPERTSFDLARNLMADLRYGGFERTTDRLNLANPRGRRHTVEATHEAPVGVLSRPDATPPEVWLVGERPGFDLDVVEPQDRTLALVFADETEAEQHVTVLFNGVELGTTRLRRDGEPMAVEHDVPADLQAIGRNRVQLRFAVVEERTVPEGGAPVHGDDGASDEARTWPVAARLLALRFLPVGDASAPRGRPAPRPRLESVDGPDHPVVELAVPTGSLVSVAARLPDAERVALRFQVVRADAPLEVWAVTDDAPAVLLTRTDPALVRAPLTSADLSPWRGRPVLLVLRVPPGEGEVVLRGLALLVPAEEGARAADGATDVDRRIGDTGTGGEPTGTGVAGDLLVLRDGELPHLALVVDDLRLEVDLATRARRLFDLSTEEGARRDLSTTRVATAAWLYQELCAAVERDHPDRGWVELLRSRFVRT